MVRTIPAADNQYLRRYGVHFHSRAKECRQNLFDFPADPPSSTYASRLGGLRLGRIRLARSLRHDPPLKFLCIDRSLLA
jgi:hypothetical protein